MLNQILLCICPIHPRRFARRLARLTVSPKPADVRLNAQNLPGTDPSLRGHLRPERPRPATWQPVTVVCDSSLKGLRLKSSVPVLTKAILAPLKLAQPLNPLTLQKGGSS